MDEIDRLALPFDQYQRYSAAAQIAELLRQHLGQTSLEVLDVGGLYRTRWGQTILPLAHFLPQDKIIAADLIAESLPRYLVASGQALPFGHSFDLVVTCDTLEHVTPAGRPGFVAELLRVTRHVLVLIAPFGNEATRLAERMLAEYMAAKGIRHVQLQEHADYGLPDAEALRDQFARLSLASLDLPDGYLHHWLAMMMVKHTPGYSLDFHLDLDRYYNRYFSPHDRREPSYRRVFVVARPDSEALLPDVMRVWESAKPEPKHTDIVSELLRYLNQHESDGLHFRLSRLEAENAGLRQKLEAYEQGRFISFMRWLHQKRTSWLRGPTP